MYQVARSDDVSLTAKLYLDGPKTMTAKKNHINQFIDRVFNVQIVLANLCKWTYRCIYNSLNHSIRHSIKIYVEPKVRYCMFTSDRFSSMSISSCYFNKQTKKSPTYKRVACSTQSSHTHTRAL